MMAAKARLFGDTTALEKILQADNPAVAKYLGQLVNDFDEDTGSPDVTSSSSRAT